MKEEFQEVLRLYKEEYLSKGYLLTEVKAIYFPIWKCKQEVIIATQAPIDRFSQVVLQTIAAGHSKHEDICAFLGIEADSFVLGQFHYLLKQDWIRIDSAQVYWLTPKGKALLEKEANIKQLKTVEFEYYTIEPSKAKKGTSSLQFFNPKLPLNSKWSEAKQTNFKGYRIFQNNRLEEDASVQVMPHHQNKAPNLNALKAQRNDFAAFFKEVSKHSFYDFGKPSLKCHPHSLCFLQLRYTKEEDAKAILVETRQFSKSVVEFGGFELEEKF
ncbi:MAG: hypothetical protein JKY03_00620 [Aureispira sp.]|nr:hypothetical protein [Aureispira sp.]